MKTLYTLIVTWLIYPAVIYFGLNHLAEVYQIAFKITFINAIIVRVVSEAIFNFHYDFEE